MALNHSQTKYPFIVNPDANKVTLVEHIRVRSGQIQTVANLAAVMELNAMTRQTLHGLVLELGLQKQMLRQALGEHKP